MTAPTTADVDALMAQLGINTSGTSLATNAQAKPASSAPAPGVSCGPGRGASCGPGARGGASCGPGGRGRGGASSGPGARTAVSAGPGAKAATPSESSDVDNLLKNLGIEMPGEQAAQPGCYLGHPFSNFLLVPEKKPVNAAPLQVATHTPEGYAIEFIGPQCAKCGEPIVGRVFSALDKEFHPECFTCDGCEKVIEDEEPFMQHTDGKVYCEICYNDKFGLKCHNCKKAITDKCVKFMDRLYHPEHFSCVGSCNVICMSHCLDCGTKLVGAKYIDDEGEGPFCLTCKNNRVKYRPGQGEICAKCKKPINGPYLVLNGQKIHPEHYRCEECGAEFLGGNCRELEGKNFCEECFYKRLKNTCGRCGKPIQGRSINALKRVWHPVWPDFFAFNFEKECFCCTVCDQPFQDAKYFEHEGQAYCAFHFNKLFGKVCNKCQRGVGNDGLEAFGKYYHPDCFVCGGCTKSLIKQKMYEWENKALCKGCFNKLPKDIRNKLLEKRKAEKKAKREAEKMAKK